MKKKLILISALFALMVAMCSGGIAFASETTVATDKQSDGFSVECYSAYLTDYATGAELYSQNADAKDNDGNACVRSDRRGQDRI